MTKSFFTLTLGFLLAYGSLTAQSWKQHVKLAENLLLDARYGEAAEQYEKAWRKKTKRVDLLAKAAENYRIVKDYRKSAKAYERIKDNKSYPLAGLNYARALKQDGQYDLAKVELVNFLSDYKGSDMDVIQGIVQTEIKGTEMAIELGESPANNLEIEHLSSEVNTPETEFAPMPFADDILYFSSTMGDKAKIYRSQRQDGKWVKATIPDNFPVIKDKHYCNGTLAPDGQRFYFNICESNENWGSLSTQCQLYVIKREDSEWSSPEPLRDYINMKGVTTTQPHVVHKDDKELLYFASNREGGYGGMDIWVATRDLSSTDIDFTFPENVGGEINTIGDEITPFYDLENEKLYFASNGHITLGGYDVFTTQGSEKLWDTPKNLQTPINSSADDYFYTITPGGTGGFFVSNRLYGMEKITTQHEDIFAFTEQIKDIVTQGTIYDDATRTIVNNAMVSLYDVTDDSRERLLTNKNITDGRYFFPILPNRKYKVEIMGDGYMPKGYNFDTYNFANQAEYGEPIYLAKIGNTSVVETEVIPTPPTSNPAVVTTTPTASTATTTTSTPTTSTERETYTSTTNSSDYSSKPTYTPTTTTTVPVNTSPSRSVSTTNTNGASYTTRGQSAKDSYKFITNAPRHQGTYYKVQLIAVAKYDGGSHRRYNAIRNIARMDTEYIIAKKLTRVLLADYFSLGEAERALREVQNNGFSGAFIIRYEDGERIGRI
ncbi:MAG: hypothetical protein AB8G22_01600 [Saprospiraceae bacterium]